MHGFVIFLIVMFSIEALLTAAKAGGWKFETKPGPGWYAFYSICYALTAAGIACWLG